jgi:hypothetical protein
VFSKSNRAARWVAHIGYNLSEYPRADFFDSEDHLAQPCQYLHSLAVAELIAGALGRTVVVPSADILHLASTCPK